MAFKQVVKTVLQPKIALRELFEEDTSSAGQSIDYKAPSYLPDSSQRTGAFQPFVKLGGAIVSGIEKFTIDQSGFLPTISMTFVDSTGKFAGDFFPKTNLILETYIKVANEKLKPFRMDFLVTSVRSIPNEYTGEKTEGVTGTTYIIKGDLYVPNLYKNVSKSYSNMTSKEALLQIAKELGLGFAENNCFPRDRMTWINPNMSYFDFIQSIVSHAYEKEDSFFTVFIDNYYILNFIEVNTQIESTDFDYTLSNYTEAIGSDFNQSTKNEVGNLLDEDFIPNYLSSEFRLKGSSNYILELNLLGDQGEIIKNKGYRKKIYYYDHLRKINSDPSEKIVSFYKEPIKSITRGQDQYLIPEDEALSKNQIVKWMSIDYGNTHPEYNAARLINHHNLSELHKINLKVKLRKINFQVMKGFRVPVFITLQEAERLFKTGATDESQDNAKAKDNLFNETIDTQLSGYYYVLSAKYHYDELDRDGFYTELILARREWQPSKIIE